ncbi:hypothetical protein CEXT_465101 [Caerostris extrusa]|uniref:Uncharacterized protein n=1 Tax=Caerostris extrusa TaxID=172846 RepID=A0AAV4RIS5_CAEEX|nr:hypothetical protein CEXT_465101 [Caerostris extrusa]
MKEVYNLDIPSINLEGAIKIHNVPSEKDRHWLGGGVVGKNAQGIKQTSQNPFQKPVQRRLKGSEEIQCEMRRLYCWDLPAVMIEKELNNSAFDYWSVSSSNLLCSGECVAI